MTTQNRAGRRFSALFATATAAALTFGGLTAAPTIAFADDTIEAPAAANAAAQIAVTPGEANTTGLKLKVDVSGITLREDGAQVPDTGKPDQGVYVAVVKAADRDKLKDGADAALVADFKYKTAISGGATTSDITVPAEDILENKDYKQAYKIVVWRAHGNLTDDRLIGEADYTVTQNQYNALKGVAPTTATSSIVSVSANTIKVKVDLENLAWPTGSYVSVYETGTESDLGHQNMGAATDWITPSRVTNGSATTTLTLSRTEAQASGQVIDRTKQYSVMAWEGHTLPTSATIFYQKALDITEAQWDTVYFPFTDVDAGSVHYPSIQWVYDQKITTGTSADKFSPKKSVTRAQMALFLYRLAGEPSVKLPAKSPFPDLDPSATSYKAINWLVQQKITNGVKKGGKLIFDGSATVTRGQMSAFLYRYSGSPEFTAPKKSSIDDVPVSNVFYKEISWLASEGITTPYTTSSGEVVFRPKNDVLREQMATFLYRLETNE